jgi:signal transduction histidine kinase
MPELKENALKALFLLLAIILSAALCVPFYYFAGGVAGMLFLFPVVLSGWFWGIAGGFIAGLLSFIVTSIVFNFYGMPAASIAIVLGIMIGWMHDLYEKLRFELKEKKLAEIEKEKLFKKVEELNRKKTEFVSDVSHELRTPLASIKGFVSTIRNEKEMDEKTKEEFLKIVEEESDRLARLIEDLLDLSRIESGRLRLNILPFDINGLLARSIENLSKEAEKRSIKILPETTASDHIQVCADYDKTAQVLVNLLSNAIKYNKPGGSVNIDVKDEQDTVRIDVIDSGIGIAEADMPRLFEKFYRSDRVSHEVPGTGLGLALTKSLIEVQGGELSVTSRENQGSRFSFTLPKAAKEQRKEQLINV